MWNDIQIHSSLPSGFALPDGARLSQWNKRRDLWPTLICGQPWKEPETNLNSSVAVDLIGIWSLLADSWFFRSPSPPCLLFSGQADQVEDIKNKSGLNRIKWDQSCGFVMKPLKDRRCQVQICLCQYSHHHPCPTSQASLLKTFRG